MDKETTSLSSSFRILKAPSRFMLKTKFAEVTEGMDIIDSLKSMSDQVTVLDCGFLLEMPELPTPMTEKMLPRDLESMQNSKGNSI